MSEVETAGEPRLAKLLERAAELLAEKDRIAAEEKRVNTELRAVEDQAVELLALSGLDNVRVAGKTWRRREFFSVSIPADKKDEVLKAARKACPEYVTVNTSSLKSWLMEQRKARGDADSMAPLAEGTPFDGLVKEFREVRLAHLTVG